jgi:hypothetical protein
VPVDGCILLPGLIDSHIHLGSLGISDVLEPLQLPWSYFYFAIPRNAWATFAVWDHDRSRRRRVGRRGRRPSGTASSPGPRMQLSLTLIHQTGTARRDGRWPRRYAP